ncbi:MAG: phosphoribosylformylglycinamidine cyclo-ligase [Verrucomicrobiota bacterium]
MKKAPAKKTAYAKSGVDIDLSNSIKSGLGARLKSTRRPEVLSSIGGFGGLFDAKFSGYKHPVLVTSIDGVGTKLKVASMMNQHESIGEDLVNHCVDDIAVLGAEPLFFLDYVGTSKLDTSRFHQILKGLTRACKQANCALIGGETAQMPGIYHGDDYDLVGTIVGVVDKTKIIDGKTIKPGDVVVGFPSSGLHTNGFSLAREILFKKLRMRIQDAMPGTKKTLGDALLAPHINYQLMLKELAAKVKIKGLAHITGGGFIDNIPRVLPKGVGVEIQLGAWKRPPIFDLLESKGKVSTNELYQVFNMGIGMVAIVAAKDAPKVLDHTKAWVIGSVTKGSQKVKLVS